MPVTALAPQIEDMVGTQTSRVNLPLVAPPVEEPLVILYGGDVAVVT